MAYRPKIVFQCLGLVLFLGLAGCNRANDDKSSPAASIGSGDANSPTTDGSASASSKKKASDMLHPVVVIETSLGDITIKLDREKSLLTVDNFLSYVDAGHYEQTIVHQVYKNQGFLAGGYDTNLVEKPSRTPIRNEANNGLKNRRGTIAMVRSPDAIDSATCQFIVNVADNPILDYKDATPEGYGYCVFGEVTEGMAVVDRIAGTSVYDTPEFECMPMEKIVVKSIRLLR